MTKEQNHYKEEILAIARNWEIEQLDAYIIQLTTRISQTQDLLKEIQKLRRTKTKNSKLKENGTRGGK